MARRPRYPTCRACGDPIVDVDSFLNARHLHLEQHGEAWCRGEGLYCHECADELFRGVVAPPSYAEGGDHRLRRGLGDPNPWRENAVRILEGD